MLKPFKHQQEFYDMKVRKALLAWEAGTGKSVGATLWAKDFNEDTLILCPKKIVKKWEKTLKEWGATGTVVSDHIDTLNKYPHKKYSSIIVDEAHNFFSSLYIPKSRSARSVWLYNLIKDYNMDTPLLLTTATPICSTPANLHTGITFLGHNILWKDWRAKYYELTKKPYMQFMGWLPKDGWQKMMQPDLNKYSHIVNLRDCEDLPPVTVEKIQVKTPKYVQGDDHNFYIEHRHEQQNKLSVIKDIAKGHRKLFIVAYYVEQIEQLQKELQKDRPTFVLYGKTKDQEEVIRQAQESEDCYFICQSGTGEGFDADTFSCMVFASMGFAVKAWVQMKARIRRIHNLQPVKYVYLLAGRCDRRILSNIENGKDFIPAEWD